MPPPRRSLLLILRLILILILILVIRVSYTSARRMRRLGEVAVSVIMFLVCTLEGDHLKKLLFGVDIDSYCTTGTLYARKLGNTHGDRVCAYNGHVVWRNLKGLYRQNQSIKFHSNTISMRWM